MENQPLKFEATIDKCDFFGNDFVPLETEDRRK